MTTIPSEDGVYRDTERAVMGPEDGQGFDAVDSNPASTEREADGANARQYRRGRWWVRLAVFGGRGR